MQIKVLGSAAAEGVPALWCECETCEKVRKAGGKDIRRRTSYLIDDDTLVDLGPDFFWQTQAFGIDERKLKRLLLTHPHSDHWTPVEMFWRCPGYSKVTKELHLLGGRRIFTRLMAVAGPLDVAYDFAQLHLRTTQLEHGKYVEDGDLGILPLKADHDLGRDPLVYVISRGGRKAFICNDTGFLPEDSLKAIAGQQIDLVLIDSTMGLKGADCDRGHMGVNVVVKLRDRLMEIGALKPDAQVYANHFTHNGAALHSDLEAFFLPKNIKVAYDGLTLHC